MEERYISTDQTGWLRVRLESSGTIVPLPQYLKVLFDERRSRRDYFEIKEGSHKGKQASVLQRSQTASWLGHPLPNYRAAVNLVFKKSEGTLTTPNGKLTAITDETNQIPNGTYPIQIPDFPHSIGRPYLSSTSKAMTWFYLGIGNAVPGQGDRYLHPGRVSAGCVTVTDLTKWDALYSVLILSRTYGGKNVGTLTVES